MSNRSYPIVIVEIAEDEGGGYVVYAPDLPGCMADGDTRAEAASAIEDAIDEWICEAQESGQIVPEPGVAAARMTKLHSSMASILKKQDELLDAKEALVNAVRKKSEELEEALAEAQQRAPDEGDAGWFHLASISKKDRNQLPH